MSPLIRGLRAVTALATVWCLACSSLEPLLTGLLGSDGGEPMTCASESAVDVRSSVPADPAHSPALGAVPVDRGPSAGDCCGWQGCFVRSPAAGEGVVAPLAVVLASGPTAATLTSIVREPLVPPPQRAL